MSGKVLKRLVNSHPLPALAWEAEGSCLLNSKMRDVAKLWGITEVDSYSSWAAFLARIPGASAFLEGKLQEWVVITPDWVPEEGRYRIEGMVETNQFLILLHQDDDSLAKSFDLESTYQLLAEHSRTITWEVDAYGKYTYVSPVVEKVLGYKPEDLIGKAYFYDLFPVDRQESFRTEAMAYFQRKAEFKDFVNEAVKSDGSLIWLSTNGIPFTDKEGNLLGYKGNDTDISERIAAELQLKEQAKLLRLVTDNMFDMVVLKDMDACITYVAKAHHSLGYEASSLIGHSCLELVHEEDVEYLSKEINRLKADQNYVLKAEYRVRCFDGSYVWLESLGRVLLDDAENPYAILFSSRDVTERRKAQSDLKLSTLRFKHLFENMAQGVVYQDSNGNIIAVNPAAEEILGFPAEVMMGRTSSHPEWYAIREDGSPFPGEEHPAMIALKTRQPVRDVVVGVLNNREKSYRWLLVSAVPFDESENKAPSHVFASFTDITKLVKLEKSLKENERFLQDIIQNSGSLIYVKNTTGEYRVVNKLWEEMLGLKVDDVIGKKDFDLFPEVVANQCVNSDMLTLNSNAVFSAEEIIYDRLSGEERVFLTVKFPLTDDYGEVTGVCGMSTDVSDLKRAELALQKSEAQLKALLEGAANPIWSVNKDLELTFANHIFFEDFKLWVGSSLQMGAPFIQLLPQDLQDVIKERFNRVFNGEIVRVKEEIPTHEGVHFLSTTIYPVIIQGDVTGAAVFSINITNEERARKALEESESRFRSLFDDNASAMFIYNPYTNVFVDCNPAAERLFGFKRQEFLNLKPSQFVGEQQIASDNLNRLLREKSIREERQLVQKSGSIVDVEVYSSLIPDGQNWLVYEIIHDITIQNRYFEAMESQNKILKDIAWTQSHLVRAPLARILGLVDMLKEKEYSEMSQDQIIQLICTSSEELDAVIRDISEKAYLAGKFEPSIEVAAPVETQSFVVVPDVMLVDDDRIILTMHKGAVVKQGLTEAPYLFMNGETAFQHLIDHDSETKVFIVFLDLNMPVMDGWEFLEKLEVVNWKSAIKVIVLTSSVDTADRIRAQQYRYVVSYQNKPVNASMISELRFHPELKNYWPKS